MNNLFNPKTIVISSLDGKYAVETEKVLDPYKSGPSIVTMVKKRKIVKPGERLVREFNKLSKKSKSKPNRENKDSEEQPEEHNNALRDAIENISRSLSFTKI